VKSTLDFETSDTDLTITVSGQATREEFVRLYRELPDHPSFRPGLRILLDFWELSVSELTADDARMIGTALAGEEERYGHASFAVFASKPVVFGLARLAAMTGGLEQIEVMVTSTYEAAVAWLAERRAG
jgi:hypothetical protein